VSQLLYWGLIVSRILGWLAFDYDDPVVTSAILVGTLWSLLGLIAGLWGSGMERASNTAAALTCTFLWLAMLAAFAAG
jgi:hypothetical protein